MVLPIKASALTVSTQTQQILPLGANTCAPIQVTNFTPFVYNNALNSFEFTVSDPSYVAVVGSVGDTSIPLRQMIRLSSSASGVRYHVDVDTASLSGSVPVTLTLLSAGTGAPVCASVISINLGSGTAVQTPSPIVSVQTTPAAPSTPLQKPSSPVTITPAPGAGNGTMTVATSAAGSTTEAVTPATTGVVRNPLSGLCASEASAYRLWLILLVLYALVVGGLLWLEFPLAWNWAKTPERVATVILVLLVLLLGFWYLSSACRAALWMPLLAFLVAILGLLAAFWNHPRVTELLLLEEKTVMVTPPPAQVKKK